MTLVCIAIRVGYVGKISEFSLIQLHESRIELTNAPVNIGSDADCLFEAPLESPFR
jgi:hypothetical protein